MSTKRVISGHLVRCGAVLPVHAGRPGLAARLKPRFHVLRRALLALCVEVDVPIRDLETIYDREKLVDFIHNIK